jgi:hypothetical protein
MRTKASLDKIPHRRSPTTETARSADHPSSEQALLRLQRKIGNQAVGRLLHQPGGLTVIQRLSLYNTNWNEVTRIRRSSSGQTGVLFVEDNTPNGLVVKPGGQSEPALETQVAHAVHQKLSKGKAKVPGIRLATPADKVELRRKIWETLEVSEQDIREGRGLNPIILNTPHRPENLGEYRQRFAIDFLAKDPIFIMQKASGQEFGKVAEEHSPVATGLLLSPDYAQRLGFVTAVDLFLGNTDRVFSANLGNWMTNISRFDETLTLIDNFDRYGEQFLTRATDWEQRIAKSYLLPSKLDHTADEVIDLLKRVLEEKRIQLTGQQWEDFKKYFVRGMKKGIDRILSKLAPQIGRRSRTLKREIKKFDAEGIAWTELKKRAAWLRWHK